MKRCRNPGCGRQFAPNNSLQVVCSAWCGMQYAKTEKGQADIARVQKRELREWRASHESLATLTRRAQAAFNRYVRARDAGLPCISCGATPEPRRGGTMDCGHYRSTGAMPSLRFEPDNAAAQCVRCNRDLSGNTVEFRRGLLQRIGPDRLAWVDGPHPIRRWTRDELREIRQRFDLLTRELTRRTA